MEEYGLLGESLSHSFSPKIHSMLGLTDYGLFCVPKDQFSAFMEQRAFRAINVTIPYKKDVIPYLKSISERAKAIGSVNTVVKDENGDLHGDNTDYLGLRALIERTGISLLGKKVLVLGSGGTSLTARAVAADGGAAAVVVISRSGPDNYENLEKHQDADIIINTTPVGMYPHNGEAALSLDGFPKLQGVIDVIYNPQRTALILDAERRGIPCASGLYMLVAQAKYAEDLFFGRETADDSVIETVYQALLMEEQNLIIYGKEAGEAGAEETLANAHALAKKAEKTFRSLDEEVEKCTGLSIEALTRQYGKVRLFAERQQAAMKLGKEHNQVILAQGLLDALEDAAWRRLAEPIRDALLQNGELVYEGA